MSERPTRLVLSDGYSVALDQARVFASLAVFVGHATRPDVLFDVDVTFFGRATIPLFLMLSGYFTARTLSRGGSFFTAVAKRYYGFYFLVIPAALLVWAADAWMIAQSADLMMNFKFDSDLSFRRVVVEFFQALTFSGEYWALSTKGQGVFSNQPFWTLDYILAYAVMTAALYLLRGWVRWLAVIAAGAIAGPTVLLLSPLWWAGVLAFELHRRATALPFSEDPKKDDRKALRMSGTKRWALPVFVLGLVSLYAVDWTPMDKTPMGRTVYLGEWLYLESKDWASHDLRQYLGMAKRFLWQWAYVPGLFAMLVASRYLIHWQPSERVKRLSRLAARYSLPVFILHFSAMYFVQSLIPNYQASYLSPDPYIMVAGTIAICILYGWCAFAFVKPALDRLARHRFGGRGS